MSPASARTAIFSASGAATPAQAAATRLGSIRGCSPRATMLVGVSSTILTSNATSSDVCSRRSAKSVQSSAMSERRSSSRLSFGSRRTPSTDWLSAASALSIRRFKRSASGVEWRCATQQAATALTVVPWYSCGQLRQACCPISRPSWLTARVGQSNVFSRTWLLDPADIQTSQLRPLNACSVSLATLRPRGSWVPPTFRFACSRTAMPASRQADLGARLCLAHGTPDRSLVLLANSDRVRLFAMAYTRLRQARSPVWTRYEDRRWDRRRPENRLGKPTLTVRPDMKYLGIRGFLVPARSRRVGSPALSMGIQCLI